jgi:hypothetical protein
MPVNSLLASTEEAGLDVWVHMWKGLASKTGKVNL